MITAGLITRKHFIDRGEEREEREERGERGGGEEREKKIVRDNYSRELSKCNKISCNKNFHLSYLS
jgi:hypothetical protein